MFKTAQANLEEAIQKKIDERLKRFEESADKKIATVKGMSFHMQANHLLNLGDFATAEVSAVDAINQYLIAQDYGNLRSVFTTLDSTHQQVVTQSLISKVSDVRHDFKHNLDVVTERLEKANTNNQCIDLVAKFQSVAKAYKPS